MCIILFGVGFFLFHRKTGQEIKTSDPLFVKVLVVPHHDLIVDLFPDFYASIPKEDRMNITRVVLLAPNHFQPYEMKIKTKETHVVLPDDGGIEMDEELKKKLMDTGVVFAQDDVFIKEHAVFLHTPLIASFFPSAKITPLLFTRNMSRESLEKVAIVLQELATDNTTLFIISSDFSHGLTYTDARKRDATMLPLLQENRGEEIYGLSDEYTDCPSCYYVLFKALSGVNTVPNIIFHKNSYEFLASVLESTTSYFVIQFLVEKS